MYEYKVIPSPLRTAKVKGLKTAAERFAHMLESALNAEALDGWEFLRAETLPCEERKGLTGTAKSFQSVLMFRRALHPGEEAHDDTFDTQTDQAGNGLAADEIAPGRLDSLDLFDAEVFYSFGGRFFHRVGDTGIISYLD